MCSTAATTWLHCCNQCYLGGHLAEKRTRRLCVPLLATAFHSRSSQRDARAQAMKAPGTDTAKLDEAYDTLRDEDKRRTYDRRGAAPAPAAKRGGGDDESFEHVERGSGEVKQWEQGAAGGSGGGSGGSGSGGENNGLSLANVAGLLSEAITGGKLCVPNAAAVPTTSRALRSGTADSAAPCDEQPCKVAFKMQCDKGTSVLT